MISTETPITNTTKQHEEDTISLISRASTVVAQTQTGEQHDEQVYEPVLRNKTATEVTETNNNHVTSPSDITSSSNIAIPQGTLLRKKRQSLYVGNDDTKSFINIEISEQNNNMPFPCDTDQQLFKKIFQDTDDVVFQEKESMLNRRYAQFRYDRFCKSKPSKISGSGNVNKAICYKCDAFKMTGNENVTKGFFESSDIEIIGNKNIIYAPESVNSTFSIKGDQITLAGIFTDSKISVKRDCKNKSLKPLRFIFTLGCDIPGSSRTIKLNCNQNNGEDIFENISNQNSIKIKEKCVCKLFKSSAKEDIKANLNTTLYKK